MKKNLSKKKLIIIITVFITLLLFIASFILVLNKDKIFFKNEVAKSDNKKENNIKKVISNKREVKEIDDKIGVTSKKENNDDITTKTSEKNKKSSTKKKTKKSSKKDKTKKKEEIKKSETTKIVTSKSNINTTKVVSTTSTTKSKAQVNDELRNKIRSKYGVLVSYKDEIDSNYSSSYVKPTKLYDDNEIYDHLVKIDGALSRYPSTFFPEIKRKWKQVTIDLVKKINNSAAGLTDNRNPNTVVILINTGSLLFESTLHHEMMHYIDCYLANKIGASALENSMMEHNPSGFTYGNQNNDYVYRYANPYYFLSGYAKTNYKEDRAVIFEDLMTRTWKREYHVKGNPINEKAKVISKQMSMYLDSVSDNVTESWEKFIEW